MSKKSSGKQSNAQRSNAKNPNNSAYRHAQSNQANQLNPQHKNHSGDQKGGSSAAKK